MTDTRPGITFKFCAVDSDRVSHTKSLFSKKPQKGFLYLLTSGRLIPSQQRDAMRRLLIREANLHSRPTPVDVTIGGTTEKQRIPQR